MPREDGLFAYADRVDALSEELQIRADRSLELELGDALALLENDDDSVMRRMVRRSRPEPAVFGTAAEDVTDMTLRRIAGR